MDGPKPENPSTSRREARIVRAAAAAGILFGLALPIALIRHRATSTSPSPVQETSRDASTNQIGGSLLLEDVGPLEEILFHYVPKLEAVTAEPYTDFLRTLPGDVRLVAVVPQSTEGESPSESLRAFLSGISPSLWARARVVKAPGPLSVWSKDRALVTAPVHPADSAGKTGFLVPIPPASSWIERRNDWDTLRFVARGREDSHFVYELPLEFDAGDFAVTTAHVLVDINLFTKNRSRLSSPEELKQKLEVLFRSPVLVLGQADENLPRHHMSMYMTPLGHDQGVPVALVGDPRRAKELVGASFDPKATNPDTANPSVRTSPMR